MVNVVASDLTDGEGLENVLSPPLLDSCPPPTVLLVPVTVLGARLGAMTDRGASDSVSVEMVVVKLLPPAVGGTYPSAEKRAGWSSVERLQSVRPVANEYELWPLGWSLLTCPD